MVFNSGWLDFKKGGKTRGKKEREGKREIENRQDEKIKFI